jgi:phosphinothricin acetyltransferase
MDYSLEPMSARHRQPVMDILNYYIENSHAAYPEKPLDYHFFDRLLEMTRAYPALVVKSKARQIVGFGFLRPCHFAETLRRTAEVTCFIRPEHTRRGLGTTVLDLLCQKALEMGLDSILASVSSRNEKSLTFHLKHGFKICGRFHKVGRKFGADFDMVWLQKWLFDRMDKTDMIKTAI